MEPLSSIAVRHRTWKPPICFAPRNALRHETISIPIYPSLTWPSYMEIPDMFFAPRGTLWHAIISIPVLFYCRAILHGNPPICFLHRGTPWHEMMPIPVFLHCLAILHGNPPMLFVSAQGSAGAEAEHGPARRAEANRRTDDGFRWRQRRDRYIR